MKDFAMTSVSDRIYDGYDFVTVNQGAEVAQRVRVRLYSIYGEWIFDTRMGLPQFDEGGIHDMSIPHARKVAIIRRYIVQTEGVNNLTEFSVVIDSENKAMRVAYVANTVYGEVSDEVAVS